MIKLLVVPIVILSLGATSSGTSAEEITPELLDRLCGSMGDFAEAVMARRQEGVVMSALRAAVLDPASPYYDAMSSVIIEAYGKPRYSTEEYRAEAITNFRNDTELTCYQTF